MRLLFLNNRAKSVDKLIYMCYNLYGLLMQGNRADGVRLIVLFYR